MSSVQGPQFLKDYFQLANVALELTKERIEEILAVRDLWKNAQSSQCKVIFVGNGGSAGIASHLAIDLAKNAAVRATCFNDAALITCLANDYGYENWMKHAVTMYGDEGDVLVAISSSGSSQNILSAVQTAREKSIECVTLSGFKADNALRQLGDINMWCDSRAYNIVETAHQFWMMATIDLIIGKAEYPAS